MSRWVCFGAFANDGSKTKNTKTAVSSSSGIRDNGEITEIPKAVWKRRATSPTNRREGVCIVIGAGCPRKIPNRSEGVLKRCPRGWPKGGKAFKKAVIEDLADEKVQQAVETEATEIREPRWERGLAEVKS